MTKLNKSITGIIILLLLSGLFIASCSSGPSYVPPPSTSTGGSAGSRDAPEWVRRPNTNYPDGQYIVAVGDGRSLEEAQHKAKANLLQIFGMKLSDESVINETFAQTTTNNSTDWTEAVSSNRKLSASAEGILVGCEIKENAQVGSTHYALAVMEKAKARVSYADIVVRLTATIADVLNIPNVNTINGYARYLVAAELAKDIESCVNVLGQVGGDTPAFKSEREYLNDARNILSSIPVRVTVVRGGEFDPESRIQGAFVQAIGAVGFRSGTNTSPYVLEITLALSEVQLDNPNKFARYEIAADLRDVSTRTNEIPTWTINGREGHANYSEAQQRAVRAAETRINNEYKGLLEKSLAKF